MKRQIIGAAVGYGVLLLLITALAVLRASYWALAGSAMMVALAVVSFLLNFAVRRKLSLVMKMPATAAKHTAVTGTVELKNAAALPIVRMFLEIGVCNDLTGEEETLILSMSAGAKRRAEQQLMLESAHCGRLYASVKRAFLTDWFGMLPLRVACGASARMTVLPELFGAEVEERAVFSAAEDGYAEKKGDDRTEIFSLREYRAGDDVRQIHWKLSSKLDELILKEASLPTNKARLVYWEKRIPASPAVTDALADSVASAMHALWMHGATFRLIYPEREELREWEISDENTLLAAIPELAKCAATADCPAPSFAGYGSILYFSARFSEELAADERVVQFICTEEASDAAGTFTPETMRERLQRLEI